MAKRNGKGENQSMSIYKSSWDWIRCCVRKAMSRMASCLDISSSSYFIDSSYAYCTLVSYNIILYWANAKIQFRSRTIVSRSVRGTGSLRFCVKPPLPSTSVLTVGDIQTKPLLPNITDAPHIKLWKCVLHRLISDGNTLTKTPCDNFPYFKLLVCSDRLPSLYTFCTSADIKSPSWRNFRIIFSSSAERRRSSPRLDHWWKIDTLYISIGKCE